MMIHRILTSLIFIRHPLTTEGNRQQLTKKVTGGDDARLGDWPWIALLSITPEEGALIRSCAAKFSF